MFSEVDSYLNVDLIISFHHCEQIHVSLTTDSAAHNLCDIIKFQSNVDLEQRRG
jgi:hypothetical protein